MIRSIRFFVVLSAYVSCMLDVIDVSVVVFVGSHSMAFWCCLSNVCTMYWPAHTRHKENVEYKRRSKIENTHIHIHAQIHAAMQTLWVCDTFAIHTHGVCGILYLASVEKSLNESLRDQLNSLLNDVDDFHDDNRCVHFCLHSLFSLAVSWPIASDPSLRVCLCLLLVFVGSALLHHSIYVE